MSAYLISSTEINQLLKLPLFVNHFIEHKNRDAQLSLLDFIEMHYANGDVKDADYDEDMKLPFKTHTTCSVNSIFYFTSNNFAELAIKPQNSEEKSYVNCHEAFLTSYCVSSIWQPPKFC